MTGKGYTLLGAPTVIADLKVKASTDAVNTELAARLWDVAPDGNQTLVARSVYRPSGDGRQVFQLHPNGWHFAAGHVPKLELLGNDVPYVRMSNFPFKITVSNLDVRLPTHDKPGDEAGRDPGDAVPAQGRDAHGRGGQGDQGRGEGEEAQPLDDGSGRQHGVEQAREAGVEVLAAQRAELARPVAPLLDHARLAQDAEVVAASWTSSARGRSCRTGAARCRSPGSARCAAGRGR